MENLLSVVPILAITGCLAGFLAGLLGVGGGIIFVPVLYFLLNNYFGISVDLAIMIATGTSLGCMIPTTMSSCLSHYKKGNTDLSILKKWLPFMLFGVVSGTIVAAYYGGNWLSILFGIIITLASLNMLFRAKANPLRDSLPGTAGQGAMAIFVSFFSVMLGIGGGTLSVPILTSCNVPTHKAVGTASSIGLIICLPGAISTLIFSTSPNLPEDLELWCFGKISFLALLCIIPFSSLIAPLGVKVNRKLNPVMLKRLFGFMMIITGLKMLLSAL